VTQTDCLIKYFHHGLLSVSMRWLRVNVAFIRLEYTFVEMVPNVHGTGLFTVQDQGGGALSIEWLLEVTGSC
jgi:hypothetical protein